MNSIDELKRNVLISNARNREFISGFGAAFINICVTFPLNKIIFRQMIYGVRTNKAFFQLKNEGIMFLYRGLLPPLLSKTISVSVMFGTFYQYRLCIEQTFPQLAMQPQLSLSTAALLAGFTEAILAPFERVQVLLQDKRYHKNFKNTFNTFNLLKKNYGLKEYYRGITAILIRNGLSNILFFTFRQKFKHLLPNSDQFFLNFSEDFLSGALLGACLSTLFYPLNVIKTKMQSTIGNEYISILQAGKIVYNERGKSLRKIYYGVHINYTRALISWGIINASYEMIKNFLS